MAEPIPSSNVLCFLIRDNQLLLGHKKRGFGAGRWNGYGGKVEPGEHIEAAVRRELYEESLVTANEIHQYGVLDFTFDELDPIQVHLFRIMSWSGQPQETDEMRPQWFNINKLPYHNMWPDDPQWLPLFLAGQHFHARFHLPDINTVQKSAIQELAPAEFSRHIHTYG